jgi:hypothetical protein
MTAGMIELRITKAPEPHPGYVWGVIEVWHPPDGSVVETTLIGGVNKGSPTEAFVEGVSFYEKIVAERKG